MCITVTVGERERTIMGLATTFLNVVLVFMSLALFCLAIAIRYRLDEKLELLDGYNSGALPYYLMVVAGIMFFCHLVAINFCYNAAYLETRSENHHLFASLIFVVIALFLLVVISEIVLAVHASKIRDSLHDGIYKSMTSYKTNMANKVKVDKLHMEYQCCGAETYQEWFKIPWVNVMYVNVDSDEVKPFLKDGEFIKDDAPFSCCNKYSKRACVHHSVKSTIAHRNYEGHTLYATGCVDVMMTYFSSGLLTPTAILLVWVLIIQAVDVAVMRLLQTAIFEADEMGDPEGPSMAYCLKGVGGGGDNRRYLKRSTKKKSKKDSEDDDGSDDDDDTESDAADVSSGDRDDDDDDDDDGGGGSGGMEAAGFDGGGGAVLGESQFNKADTGKDEGSGGTHDDDGGDKGHESKKSKEEKKQEKEDKKEAKKNKKEEKEKEKVDKKEGKKKTKEDKKKEKEEKKEGKKKKKEDKKKDKTDKKEEKKKQKSEKKLEKKKAKEDKTKKKKDKKEGKKDKKKDKKQKDKDKKAKKKASKDNKKKDKKDKKNKKKADKSKKKKAKKDANAKKKADKKRKNQAKKEAKAKKKQGKKQNKTKKKKK